MTVGFGTASPGPGLDPDAQSYLGAAVSLVRSGSYRVPTTSWMAADTIAPLTHYPPGFPTLLAVPIAAGFSPLMSARVVIVVAAFITWTGLALLIGDAAGTLAGGVFGGLAALATPAIITQYLSVLSEPAFFAALVIVIIGMTAMARAWRAGGSPPIGWVVAVGLAGGAAVMLRYAGLALVVAAALWVLAGPGLPRGRDWSARLKRFALVVAPTVCMLGPWLLRTQRLGSTHSVRTLGLYAGLGATAADGARTVAAWLVPIDLGRWHSPMFAVSLAAALVIFTTSWRALRIAEVSRDTAAIAASHRVQSVFEASAWVGTAYFIFLTLSRLFADPLIPFDERLLCPLLLLGEVALAVLVPVWWRMERSTTARAGVGIVLSLWFLSSAVVTVHVMAVARDDGGDFAGIDWRDSPTVAWVRASDGGLNRVLYTNWPAALYFQAGRASHELPAGLDALTLRRFGDRLGRTHGVVVGFVVASPDAASPDSLARAMGLHEIARFDDGSVWELPGAPDATC